MKLQYKMMIPSLVNREKRETRSLPIFFNLIYRFKKCPSKKLWQFVILGKYPILERGSAVLLLLLLLCHAQGTPSPWVLKWAGLESSGKRLVSLIGKIKRIDFFVFFLATFISNFFFHYYFSFSFKVIF